MSPQPAAGNLFNLPLIPLTAITNRFLAPVLSAQLMTAPTGKPKDILNLAPVAPALPARDKSRTVKGRLNSRVSCASHEYCTTGM